MTQEELDKETMMDMIGKQNDHINRLMDHIREMKKIYTRAIKEEHVTVNVVKSRAKKRATS
jgi:phenolic acid decarboxylase